MDLRLISPPAEAPVSLSEAKTHLRYLLSDRDSLISSLILAATAHLDGRSGILGRALVSQTWELRLDRFPCGVRGIIELPLPPTQSVVSITYIDATGSEVALDPEDYVFEPGHYHARIRPAYGLIWPLPRDESGAVRIRFVAGYGGAGDVPTPIKHAILLLVGHWWLNPEAAGEEQFAHPFAVDALTMPYRVLSP